MKHSTIFRLFAAVLIATTVTPGCVTTDTAKSDASKMLADIEPLSATRGEGTRPLGSKPSPIPEEPFSRAASKEPLPSSMMLDVELAAREAMAPATVSEDKPSPMPGEPKP